MAAGAANCAHGVHVRLAFEIYFFFFFSFQEMSFLWVLKCSQRDLYRSREGSRAANPWRSINFGKCKIGPMNYVTTASRNTFLSKYCPFGNNSS